MMVSSTDRAIMRAGWSLVSWCYFSGLVGGLVKKKREWMTEEEEEGIVKCITM